MVSDIWETCKLPVPQTCICCSAHAHILRGIFTVPSHEIPLFYTHIHTLSPKLFLPLLAPYTHIYTHLHSSLTELLESLACQGGKMALQPSSQSDSLAQAGDHRPADPASRLLSSSVLEESFGCEGAAADWAAWVGWTGPKKRTSGGLPNVGLCG